MVSVVTASSVVAKSQQHKPSLKILPFLQSHLFRVLLHVNEAQVKKVLFRMAATGSVYASMAWLFGGFHENWWQLPGVVARVTYTITITLTEYIARGCKPHFAEWTLSFELTRAVIRALMSNYGRRMLNVKTAQFIRSQSASVGTALGYIVNRQLGTETESFLFNDLEHVWVRTAKSLTNSSPRRVTVLFYHGGGYAVLSPRMYIPFGCELQSRIQKRLNELLFPHGSGNPENPEQRVQVDLLLANYRKIPEHPHPIPPEDALVMYKYLIQQCKLDPHRIIVAGDSAGGGLAMTTMLRLRDTQPELMPLAGILSCPFVDLEIGGDERKTPHCILGDQAGQSIYDSYHPREGHPTTWGDASPVHCELQGLPPVYIQAAELDYIFCHSTRLMEKAQSDGVKNWQLEVFPNVPHVFTNFPSFLLPCAANGLDAMAEYAATQFAVVLQKPPHA